MKENKQVFPNITAGEHSIEIRGHGDKGIHQENLIFRAGEDVKIKATVPQRNTVVSLWASSSPNGAELYFDDKLLGKTPLNRLRLKSGTHTIKITKEGYLPLTTDIHLDKNQSYTIHYRLTPEVSE